MDGDTLFRPDRPDANIYEWYMQRKQRCLDQIWSISSGLMEAGTSVVLELGLICQNDRLEFYNRVDAFGYDLTVYVLNAPKETRRHRVRQRNFEKGSTFSMEVPDEIFELASTLWETPDEIESIDRNIHFINTG